MRKRHARSIQLGFAVAASVVVIAVAGLLKGCGGGEPRLGGEPASEIRADVCQIFEEMDGWFAAARAAEARWGAPIAVQMAIIYHESSFRAEARPRGETVAGLIPTGPPSSAYGYAQAIDSTWDWYRDSTGNWEAERTDFADATDFVGWYMDVSRRKLGLGPHDAYNQYLAYHEGHGGYARGSFRSKGWLMRTAKRVAGTTAAYAAQLNHCRPALELFA